MCLDPPTPTNFALDTDYSPISPTFNFNAVACKRLIGREFTLDELPSLIEAIPSGDEIIRGLPVGDAQAFIDVIEEASFRLKSAC